VNRSTRIILGALSGWPLLFAASIMLTVATEFPYGPPPAIGSPRYRVMMGLLVGTLAIIVGLVIFYERHAWRNERLEGRGERATWMTMLALAAPFALPAYWFRQIWQTETDEADEAD
jgi:hypothetical protein